MESSVTLVVYHLPKISGNLGQKYPFEENDTICPKFPDRRAELYWPEKA